MHTGYRPGQGGFNYPTLGALVAAELGSDDSILPNFVATGSPLGKYDFVTDTGYRGPQYAPLVHYDPREPLNYVTPNVDSRLNRSGGRDHYAKAWSTVLAGAGLRTGQVHGATDASGSEVVDGLVSARDFMATVCRALGIDPTKQLDTPIGRRVGIVDQGGTPIAALFQAI
jgi:hypothetical protein